MNISDLNEAVAGTRAVLRALLGTIAGQTGDNGAEFRFLCGQLSTNAPALLNADQRAPFWAALAACFNAALAAGVTYGATDVVRVTTEALAPTALPGIAVKNFAVRMLLVVQARILARWTFTSREDIDKTIDAIDAAFELAEQIAADDLDNGAYRALVTLHAAVINDLANRSRPLPRMVTYKFPSRMASLWMAQRVYYDASRNDELIAENKPVHPLFMAASGRALSV